MSGYTETGEIKNTNSYSGIDSTIKTTTNKQQGTIERIRKVNFSKRQKIGFGIYIAGFITANLFLTYNQGKTELIAYRKKMYSTDCNSEWEAVCVGCSKDKLTTFMDSLLWPKSIFSQIVPYAVLKLNQQEELK